MYQPSMRVRVAANMKGTEFTPNLAPILTEKGVAYQIGVYYVTGYPKPEAFKSLAANGVTQAINLTAIENPKVDGIDFISAPISVDNQEAFDSTVINAVEVIASANYAVLIYDTDSNLSGAVWAVYLNKNKGVDATVALKRGMQVGLRDLETISLTRTLLHI